MTGTRVIGGGEQVDIAANDETRLWSACADGDAEAFARLVATHQDRVARLAYRLIGWSGEVEDVVQDVFLAVWTHRGRFRGDCRISTWLAVLTVNQCRKRHRSRWLRLLRRRAKPAGSIAGEDVPDGSVAERVQEVIRELPVAYREVIVLRYLEELPVERVGEILGLRSNTVNVRLMRARRRLEAKLAENGVDGGAS
jgi:RNA polymerase sigma-70 factor (ECF subfamily)